MDQSALVAAVELVIMSLVSATAKVTSFSSDLYRLKSILVSIKLSIDNIEHLNNILDRPKHETVMFTLRLMEGQKLVEKCSNVKWNVFKRWYYSKKLIEFQALLLHFFQIDVTANQVQEIKRVSVTLSCLEEKMNQMIEIMSNLNTVVECGEENVTLLE